MKKNLLISLRLTFVMIVLCAGLYPLLIAAAGRLSPGGGNGEVLKVNNQVVGYVQIGQHFSEDRYFQGRPSAVEYNAAGSGGSNKGPSNPDYLALVNARIDSFLAHNPAVKRKDVPAELVTASGSGLDPDIYPEALLIQVPRVAAARNLSGETLYDLIRSHTRHPLFGPAVVNVLRLNIALNELNKSNFPK